MPVEGITKKNVKSKEKEKRDEADIYVEKPIPPTLPRLILPLRWEILKAEADRKNIPLRPLITPVQDAIAQIEYELRRIEETSMGKLLIVSGITGSGKTTFLNTVQHFITNGASCDTPYMELL